MSKVTMIGCDLHDCSMLLKVAVDKGKPVKKSFQTSDAAEMIEWLKEFARERDSQRIVFAYEASGSGFGLYDDLTEAGVECHVLAPTHLPHTTHRRKNKTDEKDAEMILDEVRASVLAGRKLPAVWVPDPETRDDREPLRLRLSLARQRTQIKNQIRCLAKRSKLSFPAWFTNSGDWSKRSVAWLSAVAAGDEGHLLPGVRAVLAGLVELYVSYSEQLKTLDKVIGELAKKKALCQRVSQTQIDEGRGHVDGNDLSDRDRRPESLCQPSAVGGLSGPGPVRI